jgi:hypothetical protein
MLLFRRRQFPTNLRDTSFQHFSSRLSSLIVLGATYTVQVVGHAQWH